MQRTLAFKPRSINRSQSWDRDDKYWKVVVISAVFSFCMTCIRFLVVCASAFGLSRLNQVSQTWVVVSIYLVLSSSWTLSNSCVSIFVNGNGLVSKQKLHQHILHSFSFHQLVAYRQQCACASAVTLGDRGLPSASHASTRTMCMFLPVLMW
jgi:ABC-type sugar transport system permease subunit